MQIISADVQVIGMTTFSVNGKLEHGWGAQPKSGYSNQSWGEVPELLQSAELLIDEVPELLQSSDC